MAGKEIEAVGQMKITTKQLETFTLRRVEDQVLLAGLVQRLTALERRLPALPPPSDNMTATAAHDATSGPPALHPSDLVLPLASSTSGAPFSSVAIAAAASTAFMPPPANRFRDVMAAPPSTTHLWTHLAHHLPSAPT